ncbi:uncharacterized protein L201_005589 [Kwoniella dendrophila CBS 6074]|uniref:Uncharacterized protein n=1 Tax=Kwoniella dendrophila CBS 6074 TaxID=1295534 RepID=A0AAX4K0K6_9TREE
MGIAGRADAHRPQDVDSQQQPLAVPRDLSSAVQDITASIQKFAINSAYPDSSKDGPSTPPEAPMSSNGSVSSNEINDHLTPLPRNMTNQDKPSLLRRSSHSPRLSAQFGFSSPTLPGLSELLVSPPLPDDYDQRQSYFPQFSQHASASSSHQPTAPSDPSLDFLTTSSSPVTPSEPGLPLKAASDSGTFALSRRSSKNRSPKVRNTGGILAPHGSFTSSRSRSSTIHSNSSRSSVTTRSAATEPYDSPHEMDPVQREKLFKAAAKGDQLAMQQLGWRPPKLNHRHTLGSSDNIWGVHAPTTTTRRSSGSSQASLPPIASDDTPSPANPLPTPPAASASYTQSDLFSDAVNLTLRSNALTKNRNPNAHTNTTRPPPRKPPRKESG